MFVDCFAKDDYRRISWNEKLYWNGLRFDICLIIGFKNSCFNRILYLFFRLPLCCFDHIYELCHRFSLHRFKLIQMKCLLRLFFVHLLLLLLVFSSSEFLVWECIKSTLKINVCSTNNLCNFRWKILLRAYHGSVKLLWFPDFIIIYIGISVNVLKKGYDERLFIIIKSLYEYAFVVCSLLWFRKLVHL